MGAAGSGRSLGTLVPHQPGTWVGCSIRAQPRRSWRRPGAGTSLRPRLTGRDEARAEDLVRGSPVWPQLEDEGPADEFSDGIIDDEAVRAIDGLDDEFVVTLVLSDLEGMSYGEIADQLGVPAGTVKSRLYPALRRKVESLLAREAGGTVTPVGRNPTAEPAVSRAPTQRFAPAILHCR